MAKQSKLSGYSDQELRDLGVAGIQHLYANKNAAWNALYLAGSGRLAGEKPVKAESTGTATKAAVSAVPTIQPETKLPVRTVEFLKKAGFKFDLQPCHIELMVLSDTVAWNRHVMRLCPEKELPDLMAFLKSGGFDENATITDRDEYQRHAPARRTEATIAAISAIDARLTAQRDRFEQSRYDADLTAFYAV